MGTWFTFATNGIQSPEKLSSQFVNEILVKTSNHHSLLSFSIFFEANMASNIQFEVCVIVLAQNENSEVQNAFLVIWGCTYGACEHERAH